MYIYIYIYIHTHSVYTIMYTLRIVIACTCCAYLSFNGGVLSLLGVGEARGHGVAHLLQDAHDRAARRGVLVALLEEGDEVRRVRVLELVHLDDLAEDVRGGGLQEGAAHALLDGGGGLMIICCIITISIITKPLVFLILLLLLLSLLSLLLVVWS